MVEDVSDLGRRFKAKYPGSYDDLSDDDVGRKVKAKWPGSYDDFVDAPPAALGSFDHTTTTQPVTSLPEPLPGWTVYTRGANAETAAKAIQLSSESGIPAGVVGRNFDRVQAQTDAAKASSVMMSSPALRGWLAGNPQLIPAVHDDIEQLSAVERVLRMPGYAAFSILGAGAGAVEGLSKFESAHATDETDWAPPVWRWLARNSEAIRKDFQKHAGMQMPALSQDASAVERYGFGGLQMAAENLPLMLVGPYAIPAIAVTAFGRSSAEASDQGVDPDTAALYGVGDAALQAALMKIPISHIMRDTGLAKPLLSSMVRSGGEMAAVGAAQTPATNFLRWLALPENRNKTVGDFLVEQPGAIAQSLIPSFLGGALTAAGHRALTPKPLSQAFAEELGRAVHDSKTFSRMPEQLQEYIRNATKDGPVENLWVNPEVFSTYWQEQGSDPAAAAAELGVAKEFAEASQAGHKFPIPTDAYASKIAPTDHNGFFSREMSLSPDQMSARETEEFSKAVDEALGRKQGEPSALDASADKVYEDIRGQLTGTGPDQNAIDSYATLWRQAFRTAGERLGVDPQTLFEPYRVRITREFNDEILRNPGKNISVIDTLVDRIRSGDVPAAKDIYGESLVEFLRRNGGLKDIGGDVGKMEPDAERAPFRRNLIQGDAGMELDRAREMAGEAGYLGADWETQDIQPLLDAIDKELRGQPVYADRNVDQEKLAQKQTLDQLSEYLQAKGVDVANTPNERIRELLQEAASAPGGNTTLNSEKLGSTTFKSDRRPGEGPFNIKLLESANPSTFLHESGHFFLEMFRDIATELQTRPGDLTPEQNRVVEDWKKTLKFLGVEDGSKIGTPQHEQWARAFEGYLLEGKAPSPELRGAFGRFRAWLVHLYRSLRGLNVSLTDEVRGVFDRILATDVEIDQARLDMKAEPMFSTKPEGWSDVRWKAYEATAEEANRKSREQLLSEAMDDVTRQKDSWWQARRDEMRAEIAPDIQGRPEYMAREFLRRGLLPDGSALPAGVEPFKLDLNWIKERYGAGSEAAKEMGNGGVSRMASLDGGVNPDLAARALGFTSGDEMIREIRSARPMNELIEAETDRQMREKYGDVLIDGSLPDMARAAVVRNGMPQILEAEAEALAAKSREVRKFERAAAADEKTRQEVIRAKEKAVADARLTAEREKSAEAKQAVTDAEKALQAERDNQKLQRRIGRATMERLAFSAAAARDLAESRIAETSVRDTRPAVYFAALRKFQGEAARLAVEGKYEEAVAAKNAATMNAALYRAAVDAREFSETAREYARSFDEAKKRERLAKADLNTESGTGYLDQIDQLLERFEFRRTTNRQDAKREGLVTWAAAQAAKGNALDIDPALLLDANRKPYRDLTNAELSGLYDTLKSIEYNARNKDKLMRNQAKRELGALATEGAGSIDGNKPGGPLVQSPEPRLPGSDVVRKAGAFLIAHRPMLALARQMDGYKDGFMFQNVWRQSHEARNAEHAMGETAAAAVMAIDEARFRGEESTRYDLKYIPEIRDSMSLAARLAVALNYGNEGNRERMRSAGVGGFGPLSDAQQRAIIDTLDARDWDYVRGIAQHIESYWAEIAEKHRRMYGVDPKRVEAAPFRTKFGEETGWYYPIMYEGRVSARALPGPEATFTDIVAKSAYARFQTAHGHEEARAQSTGIPLRADLGVIGEHLQQVIHDLTHAEMLRDVGKLMGTREIQDAIYRNYGDQYYSELKGAFRDIAIGPTPAPDWYRMISAARSGFVMAHLAWNTATMVRHVANITSGMTRVGPAEVLLAIPKWIGSARDMENSAGWISQISEFMARRWQTRNEGIQAANEQIGLNRGKMASMMRDQLDHAGLDPNLASRVSDSYLYGIHKIMQIAEIPTWLAAYRKALDEGVEHPAAVASADNAVLDAYGGGDMMDLAGVQRSWGGRLFTTFMQYGLSLYRNNYEIFHRDTSIGRKVVDAALLNIIPAALLAGIFQQIHGKDSYGKELAGTLMDHALGMVVLGREMTGFLRSADYQGPSSVSWIGQSKRTLNELATGLLTGDSGRVKKGAKDAAELGAGVFGLPAYQIDRTAEGIMNLMEGRGGPQQILFGPERK